MQLIYLEFLWFLKMLIIKNKMYFFMYYIVPLFNDLIYSLIVFKFCAYYMYIRHF